MISIIIIPVYNEESHIRQTVGYLRANDPDRHILEIIVVDGGSTDNTLARLHIRKVA